MGLFSFLRKKKQDESSSGNSAIFSRTDEESKAVRGRGKRKYGNQSDEPMDPVLPEKKRARRRLVGAVALVLAIVIGLPMVLDSEPKPVADDIVIQIPAKDKPVPVRAPSATILPSVSPVSTSASLERKEEILPPADPNAQVTEIPSSKIDKPKADSIQANAVKTDKTVANSDTQAKPQAKAEAKPSISKEKIDKSENSENSENSFKAEDTERVQAILEGKHEIKKTEGKSAHEVKTDPEKKSGKYAVQVAALATKEKIDEVQAKLKEAGFQSYTQKVATDSGERTRIRVGPFDNKEEAEQMRNKLIKSGMNGTLVPSGN